MKRTQIVPFENHYATVKRVKASKKGKKRRKSEGVFFGGIIWNRKLFKCLRNGLICLIELIIKYNLPNEP